MKLPGHILLLTCLCMATAVRAQKTISVADELSGLYHIGALPSYRTHTYSAQISSYDTTGGNNDGFNGTYSFLRRNADSSLVIFDVKGPGVVNRIWTPTPNTDTLDFYIDDAKKPALSICFMDLFSGKIFPFAEPLCGNQLGGYYCYYPILFQKHCVIVSRGKKILFHQIGYRLYEKGTKVQAFAANAGEDVREALRAIEGLWGRGPAGGGTAGAAGKNEAGAVVGVNDRDGIGVDGNDGGAAAGARATSADTSFYIRPGETRQVFSLGEGGRITGLEIGPSESFASLSKHIVLRVFWDDEVHPAIDCPVADLFGFAFGKPSMQGLLIGSGNNSCYSRIPMPFDRKARIELVYLPSPDGVLPPVNVRAKVRYTLMPRDPGKEGRFYAWRNSGATKQGLPHVFLDVRGKGHYIGSVLQAQGLQTGMTVFFEGDDSTVIDGKMRFHGTGSEDYFNGGWYALLNRWDSRMSLPLHGALDYSLPFARTGGYRFYISDKMSFEKSLYQSIEHGGENNAVPGLYTSVSYFYCNENPLPAAVYTAENTRVYLPDTINIYPQFASVVLGEDIDVKATWDNSDIGQCFSVTAGDNSMLKVNMETVPPGNYQLYVSYVGQPGGCDVSVWQRQTRISGPISSAGSKEVVKVALAGNIKITELNNSATLQFHTNNGSNKFLWRKLMLVKISD